MPSLPTNDFWNHVFENYYGNSWQNRDSIQTIRSSINSKSRLDVSRHCVETIICLPIFGALIFGLIPVARSDIWYIVYVTTYKFFSSSIEILFIDACLPMVIGNNRIKYCLIPSLVVMSSVISTSVVVSLNAPRDEITFSLINLLGSWVIYSSYIVAILVAKCKKTFFNKNTNNNDDRKNAKSVEDTKSEKENVDINDRRL